MAEISIGSAVGSGFQLIGRKPLAVMTWGLVRVLFAVGVLALYAPAVIGIFSEIARHPGGGPASQGEVAQMMSHFMVIQGAGYLAQIVGLFLSAVIFCAVTRAVIYPERGALAYLRLGPPEFFIAVISFAAGFVIAFALLICMIPFAIAVAILAAQKLWVAMAVVIGLGLLVLLAASIYVLLRFAFVVPMMVDDGQFHLFDAWTRSKGHIGSLFAIGLCLFGIAIAGEVVIGALILAVGVAALGAAAGGLTNVQAFLQLGPAVVAARLAPWLIVYAVIGIPLTGCATAIFMAPWARAYRDVAPPAEGAAATPPVQPSPPAATPPEPTPPDPSPAVA